jgi:histidinol-phosphatase (PHP family)
MRLKSGALKNGWKTKVSAHITWFVSLPADYHMHTPLCRHAVGEPTEYATRAIQLGFEEIGFSDHSPMPQDDFDDWRMRADELAQYVASVEQARLAHPQLKIKLGLEVDYLPGMEPWIKHLAGLYPWDYLIGSVHYVEDGWAVDSPYKISEWKKRDADEIWAKYFERLTMAAESRLFDIVGHADLPKKFCFYPKHDWTPGFSKFLAAAKAADAAMELNTAGLRKDCKEIYPAPRLVQMAHDAGVKITFASDAHAPEEVGCSFTEAITLARSAGYSEYCRFSGRKRDMSLIPV